jgi:hypothetical protein
MKPIGSFNLARSKAQHCSMTDRGFNSRVWEVMQIYTALTGFTHCSLLVSTTNDRRCTETPGSQHHSRIL